jgi:hypothetical protein
MAAAMMAVETVSRMPSMILHDMVKKIKRLEIELDCILKVVSSRMPHPRATTRVATTRRTPNLFTISPNTTKDGMRRMCSDLESATIPVVGSHSLRAYNLDDSDGEFLSCGSFATGGGTNLRQIQQLQDLSQHASLSPINK